MARPDFIQVRIVPTEDTKLKVIWGKEGVFFPPYFVDRNMLKRKAKDVRDKLTELAFYSQKKGSQTCGAVLKSLAKAGFDFGRALFVPIESNTISSDVQDWLEGLKTPHRMIFVLDERVQLPWGLIFNGELDKLSGKPADFDITFFQDFWCLKYSLASVYSRITPRVLTSGKIGKLGKILSVINPKALDEAMKELDDKEKKAIKNLRVLFAHTVSSSTEFFEKLKELLQHPAILSFFCHASGTELDLGNNNKITIDDLRLRLSHFGDARADFSALVLMNGCSTATGDPGGGFLEATGSPPFCGFIGTEAEIPDTFALRFGHNLLCEILLSEEHIFEIMDRLRKQHWPLSLFYSLYCHPCLCTKRHEKSKNITYIKAANFSTSSPGKTFLRQEDND